MKHPEIQEKAHAELDRVLGGRLPTFADRDNLPYITAVFEESLRWACPVPLCESRLESFLIVELLPIDIYPSPPSLPTRR